MNEFYVNESNLDSDYALEIAEIKNGFSSIDLYHKDTN